MTQIVFVRHAEPLVVDGTPAAQWPLTDQGSFDASVLGKRLADRSAATVWVSPERRASETAALCFPSAASHVREQLSEVKKPWYVDPTELAGAVATYLRSGVVDGWESRDDVIARLTSLRADLEPRGRAFVVSHGLLLTTWIHHEIGLEDPFEFWSNLGLPDAWQLNLEERSFERIG